VLDPAAHNLAHRDCPSAPTMPDAVDLFAGSCGNATLGTYAWTEGGESGYCPTASSSTGSPCRACWQMDPPSGYRRRWMQALQDRRGVRQEMLASWLAARRGVPAADPVMLMSLNDGFMYFFDNWARQADASGVDVRRNTLILTDDSSAEVVRRRGFRPITTAEYHDTDLFSSHETESAASSTFASSPAHSGFNAMALACRATHCPG